MKVLKDAMNCADCHDGSQTGKFSPFLRPGSFQSKGRRLEENFIHGGVMPPDTDLNADEKTALITCLRAEYYGGFSDPELGGDSEPGTFIREMTGIACPTGTEAAGVATKTTKKNGDGGGQGGTPTDSDPKIKRNGQGN